MKNSMKAFMVTLLMGLVMALSSVAPAMAAPIGQVVPATTTCANEGYTGLKLDWCRNICEKDYTGTQLKVWIRRWVERYRDLPYCLVE